MYVLHHVIQNMPEECLRKSSRGHSADMEFKEKEALLFCVEHPLCS
jgi:hypothetical protein